MGIAHLLAVNVIDIPLMALVQDVPTPLGRRKLVHPNARSSYSHSSLPTALRGTSGHTLNSTTNVVLLNFRTHSFCQLPAKWLEEHTGIGSAVRTAQ